MIEHASIPRIIHYCWFGPNPIPETEQKCIASWHKHMPEYQYIFWSEDTFDITLVPFVYEAYLAKKWAFVSDYVRFYALNEYGGIYLDTDIEVFKSFDSLLGEPAFIGFESDYFVAAGVIGTTPRNRYFSSLMKWYCRNHFILDLKGAFATSPMLVTSLLRQQAELKVDGQYQLLVGITVFSKSTFYPDIDTIATSDNSYCIHYGSASWIEPERAKRNAFFARVKRALRRVLGDGFYQFFTSIWRTFIPRQYY